MEEVKEKAELEGETDAGITGKVIWLKNRLIVLNSMMSYV